MQKTEQEKSSPEHALEHDTSIDEEPEDEEEEAFNPYLFIAHLPQHAEVVVEGKICLPAKTDGLPTLALDLDETLVHCTVDAIDNPDLKFPVNFNGAYYQVYVRKRPHLDQFLEEVSKNFEVKSYLCILPQFFWTITTNFFNND